MKMISIILLGIAFSYAMLSIRRARIKSDEENFFAILVCICLGWMAFCEGIFISAPTQQSAWFWHQIGAFGWSGYIGVTAWYFLSMTGITKKMPVWTKLLFWLICLGMTGRFLVARPTALATDLVQSDSGMGWTYIQPYLSLWKCIFLLYIIVYLGGALLYLLYWQKKQESEYAKVLAARFLVVDAASISVGIVTYFIIPCISTYLPPMGWISLSIFLWGYRHVIWRYDLSHFSLTLDPQLILDSSMEPMMITDLSYHILYSNEEMNKLFQKKNLINLTLQELIPERERALFQDFRHLEDRPIHSMTINLDSNSVALMSINQISVKKNTQQFFVISMHDISRIHQNHMLMEHLAYHDELTGLANRRLLSEILDEWAEKRERGGDDFLLLLLDLNNFKSINDRYGHDAGDLALIAVSKRLKRMIQSGDEIFRLSGDEFVVLYHMSVEKEMCAIVSEFREGIREIDTRDFAKDMTLDTSIGACLYSECNNVHQMIKQADELMYDMKRKYHRDSTFPAGIEPTTTA